MKGVREGALAVLLAVGEEDRSGSGALSYLKLN